jgi:hypothetical protein
MRGVLLGGTALAVVKVTAAYGVVSCGEMPDGLAPRTNNPLSVIDNINFLRKEERTWKQQQL